MAGWFSAKMGAVNSLVEKKICSLSGRSVHPAATVSLASSISSRFQAAR